MNLLSQIPSYVWAGISAAALCALLDWLGSPPVRPDRQGRTRLRPSVGLYIFGLSAVLLAVPLTGLALTVFTNPPQDPFSFVIVAFLSALSWYVVYAALVVQVTFDSRGVEYRGLFRTINVAWSDVKRIVDSMTWGTYLSTSRGTLYVSKYFQGYAQLLNEARRHGVKVAMLFDTVG